MKKLLFSIALFGFFANQAFAASSLYALVNPSTIVINLVEWDGVTPFVVTPNILVSATGQPNAQIGGTYVGGVFTAPVAPTPAQGIIFANSPVSGATVNLPCAPQPQAKLYFFIQPAAALAALTIGLCNGPQDGDVLNILSSKAITALTWTAPSGTIISGLPTTLAATASGAIQLTYSTQYGGWFAW